MPHLILEYANDIASGSQVSTMLDAMHQAVVSTKLFEESHIKARAIPILFYRVGGKDEPFIHAQLRIRPGRTDAQKRKLSDAVLAAIVAQGWPVKVATVEVVDMDGGSYAKWMV